MYIYIYLYVYIYITFSKVGLLEEPKGREEEEKNDRE
jgi:hypothetical protein